MNSKTVVYDTQTNQHQVCDHESEASDWVNQQLGRPADGSIQAIPDRFRIMQGIPADSAVQS